MNWYKKAESGIRLWLDDDRDPKNPKTQELFGAKGDEIWVKTQKETIEYLKTNNVVSISFDNDLGKLEEVGEGYGVAKWIEEMAYFGKINKLDWNIHTKNCSKEPQIRMAMMNADKFWSKA